jgi:hypothetical protein
MVVGGAGLAAYLASLPRAWAEADIDLPTQLTSTSSGPQLPDVNFQLPADAGGIGQFISDYPLALPLAAALVLVPVLISQVSGGGSGVQGVSAARALSVLETEDPAVFLDIRSAADAKDQGSPDLGSIKKAAIRLPFTKACQSPHACTPLQQTWPDGWNRSSRKAIPDNIYFVIMQSVKDEVLYDETFVKKFGKLRQITEGVTVVLLDRWLGYPFSCANTDGFRSVGRHESQMWWIRR